jgi:hypothetical protein
MTQTHAIPTGTVATDPHQRHLGAAVLVVLAVLVAITIAFVTLVLSHDSSTPAPPVVHETPTARVDTPVAPPVVHDAPTPRVDTPVVPPVVHEAPDGALKTPLCPRFGRC